MRLASAAMSETSVVWFRRDLRVRDQPIFLAAADAAPRALALFVLDPALLDPAGPARRTFLYRSLRDLDASLGGKLLVVRGDPADVVPRIAAAVGAGHGARGRRLRPVRRDRRDEAVEKGLAGDGRELVRTGSPYAVAPGRVRKADGEPFRVFTPFRRAWAEHGWRQPADTDASTVRWLDPDAAGRRPAGGGRSRTTRRSTPSCPTAGEQAARTSSGRRSSTTRWPTTARTATARTSRAPRGCRCTSSTARSTRGRCSPTWPRGAPASVDTYRTEIAWREFYADILYQRPDSARGNYDRAFDALPLAEGAAAERAFEAWCAGRTGFPIVDAGMRQLREQAWMHNRVRMIVASFLVKDLHLPWWWGARHFMRLLVDGDLASNQHGWQWTAGSGTDASPYFRVFNPVTQGEKFDPSGDYVRRFVPELRGVPGKAVHQPWRLPDGIPAGYPEPMVDHKAERIEALARYERVKAARR